MAGLVTSVTIEHGFAKILVSEGLRVVRHRMLLASPQFFWEGLVRESARLGSMLRSAFQDLGVDPGNVIGAVPGFQTSLRMMEFPKARGLDPQIVIPREASRTMGVSQETSILTWRRVPETDDRSRWLVASAARRAVRSFSDVAQEAGMRVKALDMRPFALARAVNQDEAIVAWTAPDGAEAVIVQDAAPVMYQSQFWGAEEVEADVLVYRLTEMLERTLTTFEQSAGNAPIPIQVPVYVSGTAVGKDATIETRVAENLQRPTGVLAPPLDCGPDFPLNDFVVNVGLTLREN